MLGIKFIKKMAGLNTVQHPRPDWWGLNMPSTNFDYERAVGRGLGSNVMMSPVQWIMRTFSEAPVKLDRVDSKGNTERVFDHPFLDLLDTPNEFYGYDALSMASQLSWSIAGNVYWLKVRNALGQVIQLWYVPHWLMKPKAHDTDHTIFIDHYEYSPNGMPIKIAIEDVVHFRFGIDPENTREGLSPLGAVIREVASDDEAANYTASILRNMGVPSVVISPIDKETVLSDKDLNEIKEKFQKSFGGDRRGQAMVAQGAVRVDTFGFNPNELSLGSLRNIPEERVTAALGVPAAIVGFGTGLEKATTNATIQVLKKLAWEGNIIPTQRMFSRTLKKQLLIEFDNDTSLIVGFDNSQVAALQEDANERRKLLLEGVAKGTAKVSEWKEAMGLEVLPTDEVYLRSLNMIEIE